MENLQITKQTTGIQLCLHEKAQGDNQKAISERPLTRTFAIVFPE